MSEDSKQSAGESKEASAVSLDGFSDTQLRDWFDSVVDQLVLAPGRSEWMSDESAALDPSMQKRVHEWFVQRGRISGTDPDSEKSDMMVDDRGWSEREVGLLEETFLTRQSEIEEHLRNEAVMIGLPHCMDDFDWSVRLTVSSSVIARMAVPLAILNLKRRKLVNNDREPPAGLDCNIQMDSESLSTLISKLKDARKAVSKLEKSFPH